MILTAISKRSFLFSVFGHVFLFVVLSVSFGEKFFPVVPPGVYFWGDLLTRDDLSAKSNLKQFDPKDNFIPHPAIPKVSAKIDFTLPLSGSALKPAVAVSAYGQKSFLPIPVKAGQVPVEKRGAVVMLYPSLPYKFNLYFKDRQVAHVELEYKIVSTGKTSAVMLRRKISSGSLEADLLCMRYIYHYLSMQKDRLTADKWQSVKIELELKK